MSAASAIDYLCELYGLKKYKPRSDYLAEINNSTFLNVFMVGKIMGVLYPDGIRVENPYKKGPSDIFFEGASLRPSSEVEVTPKKETLVVQIGSVDGGLMRIFPGNESHGKKLLEDVARVRDQGLVQSGQTRSDVDLRMEELGFGEYYTHAHDTILDDGEQLADYFVDAAYGTQTMISDRDAITFRLNTESGLQIINLKRHPLNTISRLSLDEKGANYFLAAHFGEENISVLLVSGKEKQARRVHDILKLKLQEAEQRDKVTKEKEAAQEISREKEEKQNKVDSMPRIERMFWDLYGDDFHVEWSGRGCESHISSDKEIIDLCTGGVYTLVLTNDELVVFQQKILKSGIKKVFTLPFEQIISVDAVKKDKDKFPWKIRITLPPTDTNTYYDSTTVGGVTLTNVTRPQNSEWHTDAANKEHADRFVAALRAKCSPARASETAKPDALEQIAKLKSLLDAGAITEAEFDEKKAKYLDEI